MRLDGGEPVVEVSDELDVMLTSTVEPGELSPDLVAGLQAP